MFDTLVVPLDGSNRAESAIPYVEEIAAKLGSEIRLISAVNPMEAEVVSLRRSYLDQVAARIKMHCQKYGLKECRIKSEILQGKAAEEIVRYASQAISGLIIITNRGSTDNGSWSLGSISAKIIAVAPCPVLLVRSVPNEMARERPNLIQTILAPLDGSNVGESAIPYALAMARGTSAEVTLFQAVEHVGFVPGYYNILPNSLLINEETIKNEATAYLYKQAEQFKIQNVKTSVAVVWGAGAEQIMDYAEANQIDLIAMSTHGESGIGRWVFGSVTQKVIQAGNTPLLIVRPTIGQ